MTNIGIMRKVDSLGRVVIPKEYRKIFGMNQSQPVEILATTDGIMIRNPAIQLKFLIKNESGNTEHKN